MQRFQFYLPEGHDAPDRDSLAALLLARPGVAFDADGDYLPGRWRDAATGARAVIDLGTPPLEEDVQHPPRQYANWTQLPLVVQLPLVCPHWLAVEGFQFIEAVLAGLPAGARVLDCEDAQETPSSEPGPFAWSRVRALASWQHQHAAQVETRTDLARMERSASLRLWRWRRERAATWPEATVLRDRATAEAHPVCIWADPAAPCVLPGLGLVLVRLDTPRLVRREELPAGSALTQTGAASLAPPPTWPVSLPIDRFAACDDEDWID